PGVMERAARAEPRSQRPSTRPTTAVGVPSRLTVRTGEPLWPLTTGWLRRKTSEAGEAESSFVDSKERTLPGERSSAGISKEAELRGLAGRTDKARTDWPCVAGPGESGRKAT